MQNCRLLPSPVFVLGGRKRTNVIASVQRRFRERERNRRILSLRRGLRTRVKNWDYKHRQMQRSGGASRRALRDAVCFGATRNRAQARSNCTQRECFCRNKRFADGEVHCRFVKRFRICDATPLPRWWDVSPPFAFQRFVPKQG